MSISRLGLGQFMAFDPATGKPLALGKVYTYTPGTTTLADAYTDATGSTVLANPVILSALGQAEIFLDGLYDIKITDAAGVTVQTISGVYGSLEQGDAQTLIDNSAHTVSTFMKTVVAAASASAARNLLDVPSISGEEQIASKWSFEEFLKVYNAIGTTDLATMRLEMTSGDIYWEKFVDDAGVSNGKVRKVTHDLLGALIHKFFIQEVEVLSLEAAFVKLNTKKIWAEQITIADDQVGTLTTPDYSGIISMVVSTDNATVNRQTFCDEFYYNTGSALSTESMKPAAGVLGSDVEHTTGVLVGTTGTDVKVTISPQANKTLMIENRSGGERIFDIFYR